MKINFTLNNEPAVIDEAPNETLAAILREKFNLKDVKQEPAQWLTGASMVLMNNKPVPASLVPVFNIEGCEIITLSFFKTTDSYKQMLNVFKETGIEMCGFCDAGKIFLTYEIMNSRMDPNEKELTEKIKTVYAASVCRCTSLNDLIAAASKLLKLERRK